MPVWEVAGLLGHSSGYQTTERYAKFGPDHLSAAVRAIDNFFADLGLVSGPPLDQSSTKLRASCVLVTDPSGRKSLGKLVEPRGVEPLTSTMPL